MTISYVNSMTVALPLLLVNTPLSNAQDTRILYALLGKPLFIQANSDIAIHSYPITSYSVWIAHFPAGTLLTHARTFFPFIFTVHVPHSPF